MNIQISLLGRNKAFVDCFSIQVLLKAYKFLFQVVRCFEDNDIVHVNGKVDPKSDIDVINLELIFSDLDQVG